MYSTEPAGSIRACLLLHASSILAANVAITIYGIFAHLNPSRHHIFFFLLLLLVTSQVSLAEFNAASFCACLYLVVQLSIVMWWFVHLFPPYSPLNLCVSLSTPLPLCHVSALNLSPPSLLLRSNSSLTALGASSIPSSPPPWLRRSRLVSCPYHNAVHRPPYY